MVEDLRRTNSLASALSFGAEVYRCLDWWEHYLFESEGDEGAGDEVGREVWIDQATVWEMFLGGI